MEKEHKSRLKLNANYHKRREIIPEFWISRNKCSLPTRIAVCRRGGASATLDRLNKYFTISNMPVVPSQYWNIIHGLMPGDVTKDDEGLQTMRTLGKNMAWMIKNMKEGVEPQPTPEKERHFTCFIR